MFSLNFLQCMLVNCNFCLHANRIQLMHDIKCVHILNCIEIVILVRRCEAKSKCKVKIETSHFYLIFADSKNHWNYYHVCQLFSIVAVYSQIKGTYRNSYTINRIPKISWVILCVCFFFIWVTLVNGPYRWVLILIHVIVFGSHPLLHSK